MLASVKSFAVVFPVIALSTALSGCGKSPQENAPGNAEAVEVTTAPVSREAVDLVVQCVGTLFGDEQTTISAKVPGRIVQLSKDFGDRAGDGEQLGQIDPTDYQLAVAQRELALQEALAKLGIAKLPGDEFDPTIIVTVQRAKVQAANALAKLDRARKLFEQKPPLMSEQDFADIQTAQEVAQRDSDVAILQAQADLAAARSRQAELEIARQRLTDTKIVAPSLPGTANPQRFAISRRTVSIGTYVREGDALFDLVADDPIKFRGSVPEQYVNQVKVDQPVRIMVEGRTEPIVGKISRVNAAIDTESRTFEVEGIFTNPEHALRPGGFARAWIVVGHDEQAVFVPGSAIVGFAGTDKVFTIKDGKAVEHRIQRGEVRGERVQIVSELKDATEVVLSGAAKLARGTPVTATVPPTTQIAR